MCHGLVIKCLIRHGIEVTGFLKKLGWMADSNIYHHQKVNILCSRRCAQLEFSSWHKSQCIYWRVALLQSNLLNTKVWKTCTTEKSKQCYTKPTVSSTKAKLLLFQIMLKPCMDSHTTRENTSLSLLWKWFLWIRESVKLSFRKKQRYPCEMKISWGWLCWTLN